MKNDEYTIESDYFAFLYATKDTIIILKPDEKLIIAYYRRISGPFGCKNLYRESPSVNNIKIFQNGTFIKIKNNDKEWRYWAKYSTLRINRKNVPNNK